MPDNTQNASQHMMTKHIPCKRGHKKIPTCVDQINSLPADTQDATQKLLTKLIPNQRGHKMHINM
jgi:hypothetical protein